MDAENQSPVVGLTTESSEVSLPQIGLTDTDADQRRAEMEAWLGILQDHIRNLRKAGFRVVVADLPDRRSVAFVVRGAWYKSTTGAMGLYHERGGEEK